MSGLDGRKGHDDADQKAYPVAAQRVKPVKGIGRIDRAADAEHLPEKAAETRKIGCCENDPRDHQDRRDQDMGDDLMAIEPVQKPVLLDDQQNEKPQSP